jgi:serine/threonine protein kinase
MTPPALPPGLLVLCRLQERSDEGFSLACFEVRDERGDAGTPRMRRAYVLHGLESQPWAPELRKRLGQLSAEHIEHVERPLELGRLADGSLYVLVDRFDKPLVAELTDTGLAADADGERAWNLLRQMALALAGLHRLGLSHGELRPENCYLAEEGRSVWITGAAWGPLASWSNGRFVDEHSTAYYPPEFHGKTKAPTHRSDIYALGRVFEGMLAGSADDSHAKALARLKGPRRKLLERMTAGESGRPADAVALWQEIQRAGDFSSRPLLLAGLVLLVFLIALPVVLYQQVTVKERALEEEKARSSSFSNDLARAKAEAATREKVLSKVQEDTRKENELRDLRKKPGGKAAMAPAERKKADPVKIASWKWDQLMGLESLNWTNLKSLIQNDALLQEEVRKQLEQWCQDFEDYPKREENQGSWWLRPVSGTAAGKDKMRQIDIYVGEKLVRSLSAEAWTDEGDKLTPASSHWISIPWEPGASVRIEVYGGRSLTVRRSSLAKTTFGGPAALWGLQRHKTVGSKDGDSVDFEVYQCPGPPPDKIHALGKAMLQELHDVLPSGK